MSLNDHLHGVESSLRSWSLFRQWINPMYWTRRFITTYTTAPSSSYSEPAECSLHQNNLFIYDPFWYFLSSQLNFPRHLSPSGFLNKFIYISLMSLVRAARPDHFVLLDFLPQKHSVKTTKYEASHCVIFYILVIFRCLNPNYCFQHSELVHPLPLGPSFMSI